MGAGSGRDQVRQGANVVGAVLQIVVAVLAGGDVASIANRNESLILPAGWAFSIWGLIFALALAYAAYQALPARREDPLLRRIGWLTAGAFLGNALWEAMFPAEWYVPAQLTIAAIFVAAALAFLRFVEISGRPGTGTPERWLIAPLLGVFLGWITAATLVGLAATLVALGFDGDGVGAAVGGAALLLLGAGVGVAMVAVGKRGPTLGWVGFGAAVVWALAGVVANQFDESFLTTAAAILAVGAVVLVGVGRWPGGAGGRAVGEAA